MALGDAIRADTATFNDIADKIDALRLPSATPYTSTSTINTTSTTLVDITSVSLTVTLTATQKVLLLFQTTCSLSSTSLNAQFQFYYGGVVGVKQEVVSHRGNTVGIDYAVCMAHLVTSAGAGSNTFKVQWATPSGGTLYSEKRAFYAIPFEYS